MMAGEAPYQLSGYRSMWLFAMFDLPVDTPEARRNYTRFRDALIKEGFLMLQFSVYARYCGSEEKTAAFRRRIRVKLPPDGEVRLLPITDHQFGMMEVFRGKIRHPTEKPPDQLAFF